MNSQLNKGKCEDDSIAYLVSMHTGVGGLSQSALLTNTIF